MKTILHVIPNLTGGGAERQLALLAAEQGRRGWNVHVALRRGGNYQEHLADSGVVLHELGDLRRGHPLLFLRLHALVRRLRPELIQTWLLQMDIVGGVVAIANGVPWVISERCSKDAYDETPRESWIRCVLGRRAACVVANSRDGAHYWQEVMSTTERIAVIPNAIDVDAVRRAEPRRLATSQREVVLCVGRLVPQKAHEILVRAVALLPPSQQPDVVILGVGPLRDSLLDLVTELGLTARIRQLPYQADWWGLLKTATALINATRFEGQPNVVLEAMAAGCPVVVSDIPQHREIVDETSALLVPRDDPGALATALASVLTDRASAAARAAAALERVRRSTVQVAADLYERVYAGLDQR